jgi:hypothetical protein
MSDHVKKNQINPFNLHYAPNNITREDEIKDDIGCVVLSSPAML